MELTFLLEECSDAFRRTDEYRRLREHRPKERSLLVDERTAINVCVQQTFLSVYKIMKGEDESFDEEDLVVCALGAMGLKTAVIADCLSVSAEAIRMRKRRIRRKIGDERYEEVFGIKDKAALKAAVPVGVMVPAVVEVLPAVQDYGHEGVKVKMRFAEAVREGCRKYCMFRGRARRAEYWYFYLFITMVIAGYKGLRSLVMNCFVPMVSASAQVWFKWGCEILNWGLSVAILIPMLAVTARRLHDRGDTGWLCLAIHLLPWLLAAGVSVYNDSYKDVVMDIVGGSLDGMLGILGAYLIFMFIEFVALVARVVMLAKPGMVGMNEYGADPIRYIQ